MLTIAASALSCVILYSFNASLCSCHCFLLLHSCDFYQIWLCNFCNCISFL